MPVLSHFRGISGDKKKGSARLLIKLSGDKFKSKCLKNVSVISKEPAEAGSLQGKRKNKILREFSAALWKLRRVSYENILAVC